MAQAVSFLIRFEDPQLKADDIATEVRYLVEDLRDLEGMTQVRYEPYAEVRDLAEAQVGIRFVASSTQLGAILRRLCDRLYYNPVQTCFLIQIADIRLQIQTHRADDLVGLMAMTQSGLLFSPERDYLAEVETYSRTQGELSPTEMDNLNLLRQNLGLSAQQAEALNARAAGPYRTQSEKRRHFEETVQAEFSRLQSMQEDLPFAPKDFWPILQELAENLGFPTAEAETIYRHHRQRYEEDRRISREQTAAQTAEKALLAAEAKAEGDRQQQAQQAQDRRDQFKTLCREAMAHGLYPSEYDQGRIDQARRLREIPQEEAVQIEAAVRTELYGGIDSAAGVDYSRLRELLHQQDWQAADLETEAAILKALNRDMQPVTAETVPLLPSVDLATIDALWSRYSGGRFGFKVQQQVYRHQEQIQRGEDRRWRDFQIDLGWQELPTWWYRGFKPYGAIDFSLAAPQGHLPTWRWGCPSLGHRYRLSPELVEAVMTHLNQCMPLEAASLAAFDPSSPSTSLQSTPFQ